MTIASRRFTFIRPLYTKFVLGITLIVAILLLPACNTIKVSQQSKSRAISTQRGNIVSDDKLSSDTASSLLSAGLDEQACLQNFDLCLGQLSDSMLDNNYRPELAVFAELHYAKAVQLKNSEDCLNARSRPPIDPYYANATLSPEEDDAKKSKTLNCVINYQDRLYDALKSSYAYLFYEKLDHDFVGANDQKEVAGMQNRLPSDIDIQTQDIYNAAVSDVVTQLYKSADRSKQLINNTKIEYLPTSIDTPDDSAQVAIANHTALKGKPTAQIGVMKIQVDDYDLNIYLPNEDIYLQNAREQTSALADLISTYELRLTGLNSISKRSGLGVSFVASLDDRYTTTIRQLLLSSLSGRLNRDSAVKTVENSQEDSDPTARIYPTGHLLMTGLIKPTGKSVLDVLSSRQLDVHLYNPYRSESASILEEDYPLAANFSAGYGLWLAENQLNGVGYLSLLARQPQATLPKLFMLEPYDPNKRVIIMLHGLASSPATWVNLTNDILNDNKLRENYQVWQIFYPTNLPILENRYQIQSLINSTYQQTDPNGSNPASSNSVIISHSMGALIARMMVSDDNLADNLDDLELRDKTLLANDNALKVDESFKQAISSAELGDRLKLNSLSQVDTVVFLSAPFRGTDYADRWFTRALRRVVYLPVGLVKTVTDNLATIVTQGDLAENPLGALYLQNGASQLSSKSSFIQLTKDIDINKRITYHSIIANNDADITQGLAEMQPNGAKIDLSKLALQEENTTISTLDDNQAEREPLVAAVTVNGDISQALTERLSDGIVPYTSAHLDGAASETVISGGHSIQENPQTILTLRRILYKQLQDE